MINRTYTPEETGHFIDFAVHEPTSGVLVNGEFTQEYEGFLKLLRYYPQIAVTILRQMKKGVSTTFAELVIAQFLRIDPRSEEPRWVYIASPTMVDRVNRFREFEEHHRADDTFRRSYRDQEAVALAAALDAGIDGQPLELATEEIFDPMNRTLWKLLRKQRRASHGGRGCPAAAPQYALSGIGRSMPKKGDELGCSCDTDLLQPVLFGDYTDVYDEYGTWVRRSYEQGLYCKLNRALVNNAGLVNGKAIVVSSLRSAVTDFIRRRTAKNFTRPDLLLTQYDIQHDDDRAIAEILFRQCGYTSPLSEDAIALAIQQKLNTIAGTNWSDINVMSTDQVQDRLKAFYAAYPDIAQFVRPRLQERANLQTDTIDEMGDIANRQDGSQFNSDPARVFETQCDAATPRRIWFRIEQVFGEIRSKYQIGRAHV